MSNMLYNKRQGRECSYGCCRTLPKDKHRVDDENGEDE